MKNILKNLTGRRSFLKGAAGVGAASWLAEGEADAWQGNVNTNSSPSDLRITDLRYAVLNRAPMRCPIIRIDTNQGVYGLGEVRDGSTEKYALMLKRKILGQNPLQVDKIFRSLKQFGGHARQAGGVVAIEMALWDIVGKVYDIPCYQLLGGKFRDTVRAYCDTTQTNDPVEFGRRMKERLDMGFTFMKMDLGVGLVADQEGTVTQPIGQQLRDMNQVMHFFTGIEITPKGVQAMADYVKEVRGVIGMEVPLAADHFGHIGVNSCIKLGRALEPYNMAWLEDMIPWQFPKQLREIKENIGVPLLTGEDIYLKEPFIHLMEEQAIDAIQPDPSTSGILETKKIGDAAQEFGVPMALHMAGSPIACVMAVHIAAATENFVCMENHSVDIPWWDDLVTGSVRKPIIEKGFYAVPEGPGIGIELNEDVVRQHLDPNNPGYFEPTDEWNEDRVNDRLWS